MPSSFCEVKEHMTQFFTKGTFFKVALVDFWQTLRVFMEGTRNDRRYWHFPVSTNSHRRELAHIYALTPDSGVVQLYREKSISRIVKLKLHPAAPESSTGWVREVRAKRFPQHIQISGEGGRPCLHVG